LNTLYYFLSIALSKSMDLDIDPELDDAPDVESAREARHELLQLHITRDPDRPHRWDQRLRQIGQILKITINLAFIHRRTIAQTARVLIHKSKGTTNQRPFGQSPKPAELGQSIEKIISTEIAPLCVRCSITETQRTSTSICTTNTGSLSQSSCAVNRDVGTAPPLDW
jgi:hypothetical protein